MFDEISLLVYFERFDLVAPARNYIRTSFDSPPSRDVLRTGGTTVCAAIASTKMGMTIQADSRTGENRAALVWEYAPWVKAYLDQPDRVYVIRTLDDGTLRRGTYTPDYLVLTDAGPFVAEVKLASKVESLIAENPADWSRNEAGEAVFRPAMEAFKEIGLRHCVIEADKLATPIHEANLRQLMQARHAPDAVTADLVKSVSRILTNQAFIRLSDLCEQTGQIDSLPFVQLIDRGKLFSLLWDELLSQRESAWVSLSQLGLDAARHMNRQTDAVAESCSTLAVPCAADAARAIFIFDEINAGKSSRMLRNWKVKIRLGAMEGKSMFQSCIPQTVKKGNRKIKIPADTVRLIKEFIKETFSTGKRLGMGAGHAAYRKYVRDHAPNGHIVCPKTLRRYINRTNPEAIARGRGGQRAANAAQAPSPVETRAIAATRPFEIGSADHYLSDEYVIILETDHLFVARPWISILVDVATNAILAVWVSLRPPSRRAVAILLRRCVRQHGRLPECIVIDHGPDFTSVFFRALLAFCTVTPMWRPVAHGRYGAQVERVGGELRSRFHSLAEGNTVSKLEKRSISKSHSPEALASRSLSEFLSDLLRYVEWHNETSLGTRPKAPIFLLDEGLRHFSASGKRVTYNFEFVVASSVEEKEFTFDPQRGIYTGVHHHWHPDLAGLTGLEKKPAVRRDPEDPNKIYAVVNGNWITCLSSGAIVFEAQDPVEQLATTIRQLDGKIMREEARLLAEDRLLNETAAVESERALKRAGQTPEEAPSKPTPASLPDVREWVLDELPVTRWENDHEVG